MQKIHDVSEVIIKIKQDDEFLTKDIRGFC